MGVCFFVRVCAMCVQVCRCERVCGWGGGRAVNQANTPTGQHAHSAAIPIR